MASRICFLMEFRGDGYVHPVISNVVRNLEREGFTVHARITEERAWPIDDLQVEYDLYVLKSSSPMTDQVASLLAARGARTLNDVAAVQRIRNKVWVDKFLRDRGVPIPPAYLASPAELAEIVHDRGPLIVKPIAGRHGVGVRVVRDGAELKNDNPEELLYAQEFKAGDGFDRKVYVIGSECWASKKVFESGRSYLNQAQPVRLTPDMRDIAMRAGELLGLEIYGVDMIESDDGLWLVDVNGFPGFKGLPGIDPVISNYIARACNRPVLRSS